MSRTQNILQSPPPPREHRRSRRTRVVKPVEVAWHTREGTQVRKLAKTDDVSPHGALLSMDSSVRVREVVTLRPERAQEWTMARVMRCKPLEPKGRARVGVELVVPSEAFWKKAGKPKT